MKKIYQVTALFIFFSFINGCSTWKSEPPMNEKYSLQYSSDLCTICIHSDDPRELTLFTWDENGPRELLISYGMTEINSTEEMTHAVFLKKPKRRPDVFTKNCLDEANGLPKEAKKSFLGYHGIE